MKRVLILAVSMLMVLSAVSFAGGVAVVNMISVQQNYAGRSAMQQAYLQEKAQLQAQSPADYNTALNTYQQQQNEAFNSKVAAIAQQVASQDGYSGYTIDYFFGQVPNDASVDITSQVISALNANYTGN